MAELNDKLITYGNLSTFYDKLQEQGLGGNAIEEVSELPNASENTDKLFRLDNGEKDVYAAKLLSSETITTNRLPDEQQIDKAYLYDEGNITQQFYYKGAYKIICSDGELDGYGWLTETDGDGFWFFYLSEDNAVNVTDNSSVIYYSNEDFEGEIDRENHIITTEYSKSDINIPATLSENSATPIPAIYNAPESAQISNAHLEESGFASTTFIYEGSQVTFIYEDIERIGYKWVDDGYSNFILTTKPASEIYFTKVNNGDNTYTYMTDVEVFYINPDDDSCEKTSISRFSENSLYIPQLNAPDSEQVDNAYITDWQNIVYTYKGTQITLTGSNGAFTCYLWENTNDDLVKPTNTNAENTFGDTVYYFAINGVITKVDDTHYEARYNGALDTIGSDTLIGGDYTASTVKYQRTEVTEVWDWRDITPTYASDSDIDDLFAAPESPVVKRVLMKVGGYAASPDEGLVNIDGETITYDGQTYYKWSYYEWDVDSQQSVPNDYDGGIYVLTTTLNITEEPFTIESPEVAYILTVDETEGAGAYKMESYKFSSVEVIEEDGHTKRVLMKLPEYPLTILEGLVNFTNDSTMTYNEQTYYKWVKYDDNGDDTSSPDMYGQEGEPQSEIVVLTTSLNPTLPFTVESPEFGYILTFNESTEYTSVMEDIYSKEALIHEDGSITYEE